MQKQETFHEQDSTDKPQPDSFFRGGIPWLYFHAGRGCRNLDLDIEGQTKDVLEQIDALLEQHGTDNTRLLQAQIWLKDINDRDAMNKLWSAWLPENHAPARACVQAAMADPVCWLKSC